MNAPRRVHLLSADDALAEGYRFGGYLTLCGEPIDTSDLPSARCPDECDCEPRMSGRGHAAQLGGQGSAGLSTGDHRGDGSCGMDQ
jgi:hypothetical protein